MKKISSSGSNLRNLEMLKQVQHDVYFDRRCAFTLAETLITLVIVGVVAALTIPLLIAKYQEQQTVAKVKKAYSAVSQAVARFQMDNSCLGEIANCFNGSNILNSNSLLKYFQHIEHIGTGSATNISWLPDKAYHLNGSINNNHWMGVHKTNSFSTTFFTLSDGTTFHIELPDSGNQSGYVFFDTNGVKGPNRIGKDQFPIGIGAYNTPKYKNKVHPHFNEDSASGTNTQGLCVVVNGHDCSSDSCSKQECSPTAYVLKYNKLPPIN